VLIRGWHVRFRTSIRELTRIYKNYERFVVKLSVVSRCVVDLSWQRQNAVTPEEDMSFNKITMVGNVGRDPEFRQLTDGARVCNFNVAVNEPTRDRTGKSASDPTWFRITVWGERAAICARSLKKGSPVYVAGRLKPRQWQDRSGEKRLSLEVKATDVRFFGLPNSRSVRVS